MFDRSIKLFPLALLLILLLVASLAACGDDGDGGTAPTPVPPAGDLTQSTGSMDFGGLLPSGSGSLKSVTITAPVENEAPVSGEVSLAVGQENGYRVTSGGGPFTLEPGESMQVSVLYKPTGWGGVVQPDTLRLGFGDQRVLLSGYATDYPKYNWNATSLTKGETYANDLRLADVEPSAGGGVSWDGNGHALCGFGGWKFNGNPTTESAVSFVFDVPDGTTSMELNLFLGGGHDCVQFLIEIDGNEHRWEDLSACANRTYTLAISPGHRTVRIGTDQSGALCYADILANDFRFTFKGRLIPLDQWNN